MGITTTAVDASAVARVLGIKTIFQDLRAGQVTFLPQRVLLLGQGSTAATYSNDKATVLTALEVGQTYGFGSPLHLAARELLPATGGGLGSIPLTVLPLDDGVAAVAAAGDITGVGVQVGAASYRVRINNIDSNEFVIAAAGTFAGSAAAIATAINAVLEMPVVATNNAGTVELVAKWKGPSGNDIVVEVIGEPDGIVFGVTQPTGGLVSPSITSALALVGNTWETMLVNCASIGETSIIDELETWAEGRWGALVRKPLICFTATVESTVATAISYPTTKRTYRNNCQLACPGSNDLPFVICAAQVAQIAAQANNNPPVDYGSIPVSSLNPGADNVQWDYVKRDAAVKGGCSTIEIKDGVVNLSDIVTFYHPEGDTTPAYRYVVDIIKIMNILFNVDIIFAGKPWDGAPLIQDSEPTVNPDAKKPKDAKAALATLTDNLGLQAIVTDGAVTKKIIQAAINSQNPKRLDVIFPVKLSGNANIISVDLKFAFFFG